MAPFSRFRDIGNLEGPRAESSSQATREVLKPRDWTVWKSGNQATHTSSAWIQRDFICSPAARAYLLIPA